jgi:hypothetical protein
VERTIGGSTVTLVELSDSSIIGTSERVSPNGGVGFLLKFLGLPLGSGEFCRGPLRCGMRLLISSTAVSDVRGLRDLPRIAESKCLSVLGVVSRMGNAVGFGDVGSSATSEVASLDEDGASKGRANADIGIEVGLGDLARSAASDGPAADSCAGSDRGAASDSPAG